MSNSIIDWDEYIWNRPSKSQEDRLKRKVKILYCVIAFLCVGWCVDYYLTYRANKAYADENKELIKQNDLLKDKLRAFEADTGK